MYRVSLTNYHLPPSEIPPSDGSTPQPWGLRLCRQDNWEGCQGFLTRKLKIPLKAVRSKHSFGEQCSLLTPPFREGHRGVALGLRETQKLAVSRLRHFPTGKTENTLRQLHI